MFFPCEPAIYTSGTSKYRVVFNKLQWDSHQGLLLDKQLFPFNIGIPSIRGDKAQMV